MEIHVYADWTESTDPMLVGTLRSSEIRGKRAVEGLLYTRLERQTLLCQCGRGSSALEQQSLVYPLYCAEHAIREHLKN